MKRIIAVLFLLMFISACTEDLGGIDLTSANNGEAITASQNQRINVKLDSNVTTGYKWNMLAEPDARIVKFVSSTYNAPIGGGIGAGGSETWQFQTVGRGTTSFKLGYYRPSDPSNVGKTFEVTITVQ